MRRVYGSSLNEYLEYLGRPNPRLYIRLNTLRKQELKEELHEFKQDEDFEEAYFVEVRGPNFLEMRDTKVVVDKKTAESAMLGSNVYKPGIKRIEGNGSRVSVVSETGNHVANGILRRDNMIVEVTESLYSSIKVAELDVVKRGLAISQGKASMYVAKLLDPRPDEIIVDMNAYPGGKLTHVYQLQPKAKIMGFDHTRKKIDKLRNILDTLKMKMDVYVADSRYLYEDLGIRNVDKVMIDPPCSALGVRPKIFDRKTKEDIQNFSSYQKQFLNSAYKILKPGGTVIYSTCTTTLAENEEVITDPRFEIEFMIRFHPNVHQMTGFFIAKLIKR
ncbi:MULTISPECIES: RsmB/NOP family class I SAM-dependent RNA methyltransferase [Metallosphaera]|uniref:RsmB/NOP family class I SAM-dependent RNA methyltransferase n=1 Tax=Metallosphaera TaxID=41980 RepID=UPI00165038BF|nr:MULTISPECIES: RsmB/NOP family class I SAM-dependent RNA methyltransferase [Metallosphaera]MCY0862846.1 RsmB/NOP family class I SAM-dependent RNA methyltransferase [Metallosphaera prunae]WPX07425.1 RsmB/NOP family class I SAM-dependent RNA methyltransferase [Metallosphaera sedula DSM 5348]